MRDTQQNDNLITLKQAAQISGYSSDYIGQLIRKEKIWGKRISSDFDDYWVTTAEEVLQYKDGEDQKVQGTYITLKEAAKISGYSADYIGSLVRTKKISGRRIPSSFGDYWVVREEDIEEYQAQKETKQNGKKKSKLVTFLRKLKEKDKHSQTSKEPEIWWNPLSLLTKKYFNFLQTISFSFLLLIGLFAFTVVALSPKEQTTEIFPSVAEGEWNNLENALSRELTKEAPLSEFSLANSSSLNIQGFLPQQELQETVTEPVDGVQPIESSPAEPSEESATSTTSPSTFDADSGGNTSSGQVQESPFDNAQGKPVEEPIEETPSTPTSVEEIQPSPEVEPTSQNLRQKLFSLFFSETTAQTEEQNVSPVTDESVDGVTETASPQEDGLQGVTENIQDEQETATSSEQQPLFEEPIDAVSSPSEDGIEFIDIDVPSIDVEDPSDTNQDESTEEPSLTLFTSQQSVTYSGFTPPEGVGDLQRAVIGISLAFEGQEDNRDELLIDWSQDGQDWSNLVVLNQDTPYSNSINKDYLYIYLPGETTWEDITTLQIRFTALSNQPEETRSSIYLDSVWIEATHRGGKEKLPKVKIHDSTELVKAKKHFGADEEVILTIEQSKYTKKELRELILQDRAELVSGRLEQLQDDDQSFIEAVVDAFGNILPFGGGDTEPEPESTEEPFDQAQGEPSEPTTEESATSTPQEGESTTATSPEVEQSSLRDTAVPEEAEPTEGSVDSTPEPSEPLPEESTGTLPVDSAPSIPVEEPIPEPPLESLQGDQTGQAEPAEALLEEPSSEESIESPTSGLLLKHRKTPSLYVS